MRKKLRVLALEEYEVAHKLEAGGREETNIIFKVGSDDKSVIICVYEFDYYKLKCHIINTNL